ncbi:hypothetical protein EYF80_059231 [Liparis tanakae]|uniref:Uncharacterized protein n=1 Tax=Liparis tanakae TaxID=230148 RepID=A0A4Z2ENU9_9TELE|nr:hypothetical protein EYF80_059231 [Liparis tanakae]
MSKQLHIWVEHRHLRFCMLPPPPCFYGLVDVGREESITATAAGMKHRRLIEDGGEEERRLKDREKVCRREGEIIGSCGTRLRHAVRCCTSARLDSVGRVLSPLLRLRRAAGPPRGTGGTAQVLLGGNVGEVVRKSDSRALPPLCGDVLEPGGRRRT